MAPDREGLRDTPPSEDDVREFRLEGLGLVLVGAMLLAALSGAFYLGRWYESRRPSSLSGPASGDVVALPGADASTRSKVVSAEEDLTAFDTIGQGEGAVPEPGREARSGDRAQRPAGSEESAETSERASNEAAKKPAPIGPWTIQIAAVSERRSAEKLYGELVDRGFSARIDTVRNGPDTVFKVRVGGYDNREAAAPTAAELSEIGYSPWVTKTD